MGTRLIAGALTLSTLACDNARQPPSAGSAGDAMLERAIEQAGGAMALGRARALEWDGDATVHAGGRVIHLAGNWRVQPPDSAVVATHDVTLGSGTTRWLVLAAPHGWLVSGGQFTPMPPNLLANERAEFYLYELMRLVSLQAPSVTRSVAAPDSLGQPGLRVEQADRPGAVLHMDARGRLVHVRMQVPAANTGELEWQDAWFDGVIEANGVRWPRTVRLLVNGKLYFDLTLHSLRVLPHLTDSLLSSRR